MSTWNPFEHHRGPYTLQVIRETPVSKGRKVPYVVDTLPGTVEPEDIPAEARALLTDPRDTITSVFVWSEYEQQHVTTYKRKDIQS